MGRGRLPSGRSAVHAPWIVVQGNWPPNPVLGWVAAFGLLQLGLPYLLFAKGTRTISGHEASFIGLLEPILVPLWAYIFWRHAPAIRPRPAGRLSGVDASWPAC